MGEWLISAVDRLTDRHVCGAKLALWSVERPLAAAPSRRISRLHASLHGKEKIETVGGHLGPPFRWGGIPRGSRSPIRPGTPAQVTAALGLLKKVMPDLASVENTGQSETTFVIRAPEPVRLASDWEAANAPRPQLIERSTTAH